MSRGWRSVICLAVVALPLAAAGVEAIEADSKDSVSSEIIDRYISSTQAQQTGLRGVRMEMEIDASLPKLKKSGSLQAFRSISKLGQITYQGLKFIGDQTIKNDVIVRYLTAEKQSQDLEHISLTPKNYKFKYKGQLARGGILVYIFQVTPKKKAVGLFKGELWVDCRTYLPVRESGRFVKNPSVFLKKIEFVRDYEIRDGIAYPRHIESTVDTRFWGPAQMSINYSNMSKSDEEEAGIPASHASQ
jgi:hypothetical protein